MRKAGGVAEAAVCYTGDLSRADGGGKYNLQYYLDISEVYLLYFSCISLVYLLYFSCISLVFLLYFSFISLVFLFYFS